MRTENASKGPATAAMLPEALLQLRGSIDNLDNALIRIVAERFKCTAKIGALKAQYGLPVGDPKREEAIIDKLRAVALDAGLDPDISDALIRLLIEEATKRHRLFKRVESG